MINVLFVCTSNTSRSIMAGAIANNLKELEYESLEVFFDSAGLAATEGGKIHEYAIRALKEVGIDISKYTSKPITDELLFNNDIVLCMTMAHKRLMTTLYPKYKQKIYTFGEYIDDPSLDIFDAFNMDYSTYRETRDDLTNGIMELLEKLDNLSN